METGEEEELVGDGEDEEVVLSHGGDGEDSGGHSGDRDEVFNEEEDQSGDRALQMFKYLWSCYSLDVKVLRKTCQ